MGYAFLPQQFLYFLPLPHGHGSFLPIFFPLITVPEKFNVEVLIMTGFLDGINDSLKNPNPIETMEEDTQVNLDYDKEKLYYNMVGAKADWLYELPQWDNLLDEAKRKELYKKQKLSGTVIKGKKIGRNEPCPCGNGKKYKNCCGKNA